ncbi:MAG: hypothetical protein ACXABY_21840 [Candidatus Thorarchaeota archaeon]|jgi:hypothetical protein
MRLLLKTVIANSRKVTLGAIILLAGISNMPLYAVQGALLTGHTLESWPLEFWLTEWTFWGFRSLIEVGVIYYMLVTETENKRHARTLYVFEALAILLILLTLGSATIALDAKELLMVDSLGYTWSLVVKFGIVGYLPIIIGGAAVAYKIQPDIIQLESGQNIEVVEQSIILVEQERDELKERVKELEYQFTSQKKEVQGVIKEQRQLALQVIQAVDYLKVMTPFKKVAIMTILWNSHRPENKQIMALLGVSMPTVIKGVQAGETILPHVKEYLSEE